jgi:hypothetical protein
MTYGNSEIHPGGNFFEEEISKSATQQRSRCKTDCKQSLDNGFANNTSEFKPLIESICLLK